MTTIDVYQTWLELCRLVNVQQNGQVPPSVFLGWYNEVNKWYFKKLAEDFQLNQVMSDLLSPFIEIQLLPITPQRGQNSGLVKRPSDYQYFVSANVLTQKQEDECFHNTSLPIIDNDGKSRKYTDPDFAEMAANYAGANIQEGQLQMIDLQRWASCLTHKTKGPTLTSPKMTQFSDGFKVAPLGVASVLLYYLRTPKDATFSYTISNQDIVIYDGPGSQQLEWSDQVLPAFLEELIRKYAKYIGDDKMFQMGMADKKELAS